MEENILLAIITELNQQLSDKTLNEVEYKVQLNDAQQKLAQLYNEVEVYRSVLDSDKDLKDLFEEIKNKNEVTA
ncbi:hypothetical protein [Streptococcus gordonii]|uniref:hypothetical protein n=1 Tax=Streptococcus gordonii TaxID=1302 RepID=UPI001EDCBAA6|nr:hypothetical protein [Streptococcus gordonii]MCG4822255.1 hypothetical protein [Streptococcus gordonii]MCG4847733.1 hypothetical protein [Streptococcus gordonii]MDE8686184.1 hypothetical protein [Streptococcus gordonii]